MKIRQLTMTNFRSVAEGEFLFPGAHGDDRWQQCWQVHDVRGVGLAVGAGSIERNPPIDEHDFLNRRYLTKRERRF